MATHDFDYAGASKYPESDGYEGSSNYQDSSNYEGSSNYDGYVESQPQPEQDNSHWYNDHVPTNEGHYNDYRDDDPYIFTREPEPSYNFIPQPRIEDFIPPQQYEPSYVPPAFQPRPTIVQPAPAPQPAPQLQPAPQPAPQPEQLKPVEPDASALSALKGTDAEAAVNAILSGKDAVTLGAAIAQAVLGGSTNTVAQACTTAAERDPDATGRVLAAAQLQAVVRGGAYQLADSMMQAFTLADKISNVNKFTSAYAFACVEAAIINPFAFSTTLAAAAARAGAIGGGAARGFSSSQAAAFGAAKRRDSVQTLARSISEVLVHDKGAGGVYSTAFSSAVAAGGDNAAGLTVATAEVMCVGGARAEAWAEALSSAIHTDPKTGCAVLVEARSFAYARCGPEGAHANSGSQTTTKLLGTCGQQQAPPAPQPTMQNWGWGGYGGMMGGMMGGLWGRRRA